MKRLLELVFQLSALYVAYLRLETRYYASRAFSGLLVNSSTQSSASGADSDEFSLFGSSGTLSYLFNTFVGDRSFSEVVAEAKDAGFTEPDPRDDLSGTDVARKVRDLLL